jgi:hypothetical protein
MAAIEVVEVDMTTEETMAAAAATMAAIEEDMMVVIEVDMTEVEAEVDMTEEDPIEDEVVAAVAAVEEVADRIRLRSKL